MVRFLRALVVGLAAGLAFLGYRVVTLERRLDVVSAQLGAPGKDAPKAAASGPGRQDAPPAGSGHEQRLARLEHDVGSLRADVHSLEEATERTLAEPSADPKQILSVVGNEASRIFDRQLQFHSAAWLKQRHAQLQQFAADQALTPQQQADLDELLTAEIDRFVELLRRQDLADKPEQFAAEARNALRDTDNAARGVLSKEQYGAWDRARTLERKTLWPWLPD